MQSADRGKAACCDLAVRSQAHASSSNDSGPNRDDPRRSFRRSSTDLLALPRHTLLVATTEGYQKYEINVLGYLLLRFNSVAVCVEQLAVLRSIGSALMVWMFV